MKIRKCLFLLQLNYSLETLGFLPDIKSSYLTMYPEERYHQKLDAFSTPGQNGRKSYSPTAAASASLLQSKHFKRAEI